MEKKNRRARKRWARRKPDEQDSIQGDGTAALVEQASNPNSQSQTPVEDSPETIRKGIYLSALIYVEGDQAPAEDFTALTKDALKDVLTRALEGDHQELRMSLKRIEVRNDVEEEEEDASSAEKGEEHFEF